MKCIIIDDQSLFDSLSLRHEALNKYTYLGVGASRWDMLTKKWEIADGNTSNEAQLLRQNAGAVIECVLDKNPGISGINIIDLGCGNGTPGGLVCREVEAKGLLPKYYALDISQEMIDQALRKVDLMLDGVSKGTGYRIDFELESPVYFANKHLEGHENYANLFLFLGNTLGNYADPRKMLDGIKKSMQEDDLILIGNGLAPSHDFTTLLHSYDNDEERNLLTSDVVRIGIDVDSVKFDWNSESKEIQAWFELNEDTELVCGNQRRVLAEGTRILLLRSRKYDEEILIDKLERLGFRIVEVRTNIEMTNILVLASAES